MRLVISIFGVCLIVSLALRAVGFRPPPEYAFTLPDGFRGWVVIVEDQGGGQPQAWDSEGRLVIEIPASGIAYIGYPLGRGGMDTYTTASGQSLRFWPDGDGLGIRGAGTFRLERAEGAISGASFFVGTESEHATSDRDATMDAAYQRVYSESGIQTEGSEPHAR